jgi:hypothetical protein
MNKIKILTGVFLLACLACKKKNGDVAKELQPNLGLGVKQEFLPASTLKLALFRDDLLYKNTQNKSQVILGWLNDTKLGTSKYELYTQISIKDNRLDLSGYTANNEPRDLQVESVVLYLPYQRDTIYGVPEASTILVHRLNKDFEKDKKDYTYNSKIDYETTPLASQALTFSTKDSVVFGDKKIRALRIFLPNSFGEEIVRKSYEESINAERFRALFKGFYIAMESPSGLVYINLKSTDAVLRLALKDKQSTKKGNYDILLSNSSSTYFNAIEHEQIAQNLQISPEADKFYLQAGLGIGLSVTLDLEKVLNKAVLNQAVLYLPFEKDKNYPEIPKFRLYQKTKIDDKDTLQYLYGHESGSRNIVKNNDESRYEIYLTEYVQKLKTNKDEIPTFYISADTSASTPNRSIIFGQDDNKPGKKTELKILYTNY